MRGLSEEAKQYFVGFKENDVFVIRDTRNKFNSNLWVGEDEEFMKLELEIIRQEYAFNSALDFCEIKIVPNPRPIKDPPITYDQSKFLLRIIDYSKSFEHNKKVLGHLLKKHMPNSTEWDFVPEFIDEYYDTDKKVLADFILRSNAKEEIKNYIRMKWINHD